MKDGYRKTHSQSRQKRYIKRARLIRRNETKKKRKELERKLNDELNLIFSLGN